MGYMQSGLDDKLQIKSLILAGFLCDMAERRGDNSEDSAGRKCQLGG